MLLDLSLKSKFASLCNGSLCFFISIKIFESKAFVVIGISIVWIKTNRLLIDRYCLFISPESIKSIAFVIISNYIF